MDKITKCLLKKDISCKPVWFMRQAGRYLPEFRKIRKSNPDFIKLCLNSELSSEITLQPIKRFDLDAAIIFSDILIVPFALGQNINFDEKKGPILSKLDIENFKKLKENKFLTILKPVYNTLEQTRKKLDKNKALIGFVGAPWTLAVYMLGLKNDNKLNIELLKKKETDIKFIIEKITEYLCLHIERQVNAGANVIQIFDSWSGLILQDKLIDCCFKPNLKLVNFCKKIGVPVISFPKGIKKEYKSFVEYVKPDGINIDPDINPAWASLNMKNICIQGGLNPTLLLKNSDLLKNSIDIYLEEFKNVPYIFNLGHGILPSTHPETVKNVVNIIKNKNE